MSEQKLFSEFPPVTTEQWEEKIKQDLKGADYEKKLISKTPDGIVIRPYYRSEDTENIGFIDALPGNYPFVRGTKKNDNAFEINSNIFVEDYGNANKKAKKATERGADGIGFFICHKETVSENDIEILLSGINPEKTRINFISGKNSPEIFKNFLKICEKHNFNPEKVKATFNFDPFGYKTVTGNCYNPGNISKDFLLLKEMTELLGTKYPQIKIVNINGVFFADAGSFPVEELAFSLASANETIAEAEKVGINPEYLIPKMMFTFGTGSNYFIEIAKLRAARLLWAKITEIWTGKKDTGQMFINSTNTSYNKTAYDPYVNQLRNTTEAMSAIIGGTDVLTVKPFDLPYKKPDDFSERIAQNTGIILREEAYFDKPADPSGGAYYIENLTEQIAEKSLNLFLEIENNGGYHKALKTNFIQDKIKENARKRDLNIALRKEILLGTNQYPNVNEKISEDINPNVYNWSLPVSDNTDTEPIKLYRGAAAFEKIRLQTEKSGKQPVVFLLTYGNLAMRKARATFAQNFFACAGYKIIDNNGFESVEEGVKQALKSNADIVVACSSDDAYPETVPEIKKLLGDKAITVIAGYPKKHVETLKSQGTEHFIHVKSNVLETLQKFNEILL